MTAERVLVLFGGRSGEHEVSVSSARSVVGALETLEHEAVTVGVTPEGRWVRADPRDGDTVDEGGEPYTLSVDPGAPRDVDIAFPVFHGPYGEDGCFQGLFELADLPYTGAGVEGSVLCLNKVLHKGLFADAGLAIVDHVAFTREEWTSDRDELVARIDKLAYPCYSKPARLGSSVGISRIVGTDEIADGVERALRHDDLVVVEAEGGSDELEVGVIEGRDGLDLSVVGRVLPAGEFYDYGAKYRDDDTVLEIPARVPERVAEAVRADAARAFRATGCSGFARIDFFWDRETDRLRCNEINSIPGLTPTSMFPRIWEASGWPFPQVVEAILAHARRRHARKRALDETRSAAHAEEVRGAGRADAG